MRFPCHAQLLHNLAHHLHIPLADTPPQHKILHRTAQKQEYHRPPHQTRFKSSVLSMIAHMHNDLLSVLLVKGNWCVLACEVRSVAYVF